jgi:hypothetical protein
MLKIRAWNMNQADKVVQEMTAELLSKTSVCGIYRRTKGKSLLFDQPC